MHYFEYKDGHLHADDVPLRRIADEVHTPAYVYSRRTLERHYTELDKALDSVKHCICFAVKANANLAVLKVLADLGSGMDVVSGGELLRAQRVGVPPDKIVFNGNGKERWELEAGLEAGVREFNVDSESELRMLQDIARTHGTTARVALRVNPDVDPQTHPYISTGLKKSKFGVQLTQAMDTYELAADMPDLEIVGIHAHIGSQITSVAPFVDSLKRIADVVGMLKDKGIAIRDINLGGGIGIRYAEETPPSFRDYVAALQPILEPTGCSLILEPGRVIVGNAGILLTTVLHVKHGEEKNFIVVDGAMNDLLRPSIYHAYHAIQPVDLPHNGAPTFTADIVGGICESGDFLAQEREVPIPAQGDLIAIMSAGAYGSTMSSNYNSRPRVPEVLVEGESYRVVRRRESLEEMLALESV